MGFWREFLELMRLPEIEEESETDEAEIIRKHEDSENLSEKIYVKESESM